jgi:hypothetical protein
MLYYILYGEREGLREQLERSVASVRRHCPGLEITVIRDNKCPVGVPDRCYVQSMDLGPQDRWKIWWPKILAFQAMEAEEALYLDLDTEVVGDIRGCLCLLDDYDIGMAVCTDKPLFKSRISDDTVAEQRVYHNSGFVVGKGAALKEMYAEVEKICGAGEEITDEWAANLIMHRYNVCSLVCMARKEEDIRQDVTLVWHSHLALSRVGPFTHDYSEHMVRAFEAWAGTRDTVMAGREGPCRGVEMGTFEGRSMQWLMRHVFTGSEDRLYCIDPYTEHGPFAGHADASRACGVWHSVAAEFGNRVVLLPGSIEDFYPLIGKESLDYVHIDGAHIAGHVCRDTMLAYRLLKPRGLCMWDDHNNLEVEAGIEAAREACPWSHVLDFVDGSTMYGARK